MWDRPDKVIAKEVTSVVWRDVHKAAQELAIEVNAELSAGWEPQGVSPALKPAPASISFKHCSSAVEGSSSRTKNR